jgi:hypothetical protein
MVGNMKGVRVSKKFKATRIGVPNVNYTSDPVTGVNVIDAEGSPAAVTFGVGVTGHVSSTVPVRDFSILILDI